MTCLGIDTVHRFTAADAKRAADNGVSFVGRYLVPAAYSSLPEHGAVMLTSDCGFVMGQCYRHGTVEE